ncbi:DUF3786 domain-containing protein [Desulfosporosinus meridiei]|uniref:DUF3786 domain-containing protein n=1 Tax=Desulfosporosinus meridiei (strain ATCC BAA-275 / DSM 13257 / KCTC 12902 / NCIMB 13706 / S10) TaxID=768704 RepID=J7ILM9_DESMD|nr:DUF3786 domain-containing protein [Desulfosporosinus meridiei]AFQ42465.1 hypothetical protein Desmer_0415 [Desulfosporosinus meridiei DSM 13257]
METNYRIAYNKYWQDLKKMVPEEIATHLAVTYSSDTQQFIVSFFNSEYIVDYSTERIYRKSDGHVPEINASIIMLNYLAYAKKPQDMPRKWVSLKELPKGGMLFYPAFHKDSILGLVKSFGQQPKGLLECAAALGGVPASFGDASAVFQAFPEIPLCVIVWEGDEEVQANATILFEPSIEHLLHIESAIGLGMYLASKLRREAKSFL